MWSVIAAAVSGIVKSLITNWFSRKNAQDAMAKAYHEKAHKDIQTHMARAYEKPKTHYNGDPKSLTSWLRSRNRSRS